MSKRIEIVQSMSMVVDMIRNHIILNPVVVGNDESRGLAECMLSTAEELLDAVTKGSRTYGRETLLDIIKTKSYRKGKFTLASGKESEYFFDLKPTMLDPQGINLIAELILEFIGDYDGAFTAIGGMAMGAIPIVSVVSAKSIDSNPLSAFFVRKEQKDHGTEQKIEGKLMAGQTVVLVEDVTTTGGSVLQAVHAVRQAGCHVHDVITVVDRLEGAEYHLRQQGIRLHALFKRTDFDDPPEESVEQITIDQLAVTERARQRFLAQNKKAHKTEPEQEVVHDPANSDARNMSF